MRQFIQYVVCLLSVFAMRAQEKGITLEKIWGGYYYPESMSELQAMPKSDAYVVLEEALGAVEVNVYDYATQSKLYTAFSSRAYRDIQEISSIRFSQDEQKLLIATKTQPIYRHSEKSEVYVYDIVRKSLHKISDYLIQEPTFNPQATQVAYVFDNDIYIYDIARGKTIRVTHDGRKNEVINGITDWVYEEEFAFVRAFEWNADGSQLAFIRFDETEVPDFSMDVYGRELYPTQEVFKYPKAGEANATVSLHIFDVNKQQTKEVAVRPSKEEFYIPRMQWTKDADLLAVQLLNRHQNVLDLVLVDAKSLKVETILQEKNNAYVEVVKNWVFLEDNSFIWSSESSGYNHLYHYSIKGKLINQITRGNWEVTDFYGYNPKNKTVYYQSVEQGSIYRDVYSVQINGKKKKRLSLAQGTNEAVFSPSFAYFINTHSSTSHPPTYRLVETNSLQVRKDLVTNERLKNRLEGYVFPTKEFFTISNAVGDELNAYIIKPNDFDENKKYPLLMYQYSGPGSQQVSDEWWSFNDVWHFMLAEKGYLVVCVDGRGTGYKGADFKKVTQLQLGKYELEDQVFVAQELGKKSYVDADRIGIWGWSFGGFMSSNALFQASNVFKMAIAVAPVTNWRFYDTIYTERYMTTPQENPLGYDDNSPITYAHQLKGNYLLVHGSADDNVHVQNAMVLIDALVHENKDFDWLIYPDKNHGIYGGATRLQLYRKMTDFIERKL